MDVAAPIHFMPHILCATDVEARMKNEFDVDLLYQR